MAPGCTGDRRAGSAIVLIVVSLFLAIGLNPAVEALQRRNLSRRLAITIAVVVIACFVVFGLAVVPPLAEQPTGFARELSDYLQQLQNHPMIRFGGAALPILDKIQQYVAGGRARPQMFGGLLGVETQSDQRAVQRLPRCSSTLYFLGSLELHEGDRLPVRAPLPPYARSHLLGDEIIDQIGG